MPTIRSSMLLSGSELRGGPLRGLRPSPAWIARRGPASGSRPRAGAPRAPSTRLGPVWNPATSTARAGAAVRGRVHRPRQRGLGRAVADARTSGRGHRRVPRPGGVLDLRLVRGFPRGLHRGDHRWRSAPLGVRPLGVPPPRGRRPVPGFPRADRAHAVPGRVRWRERDHPRGVAARRPVLVQRPLGLRVRHVRLQPVVARLERGPGDPVRRPPSDVFIVGIPDTRGACEVSWTAPGAGADGFEIQTSGTPRREDPGDPTPPAGPWVSRGQAAAGDASFVVPGLAAGELHSARVRAVLGGARSEWEEAPRRAPGRRQPPSDDGRVHRPV